ncbi:MAG: TonB-dependent receptor, partial [Spirochaetaceae bacterium]|nr:TonB-dependent receptor [Spirochaetaceae bacterium]
MPASVKCILYHHLRHIARLRLEIQAFLEYTGKILLFPSKIAAALFFTVFLYVLPAQFHLAARDLEVFVKDGDLDEPLAGAVVRLPDGSEITADESGGAAFSIPDETRGEITVTYPGYETVSITLQESGENRISVVMRAGILENEEIVIEGRRPQSETVKSGRGVSPGKREMELSSEIGLVEDVMSSIKLLPGVGYSGLFNALPSIRGGEPEDLKAALDGFYIDTPYHWGGGYSIFDPQTIESATLYHGVFSARYSYTVSGLLELATKQAPSDHADFGINVSTSAAGFNLSYPLPDFSNFNGKKRGGIMLAGKITYWEPFVYLAKKLSLVADILAPINSVSTVPYIRSLNLMANYQLSAAARLNLSAYVGGDGVGILHNNTDGGTNFFSDSTIRFKWSNIISFMTANALFTPNSDTMIKTTAGASYISRLMDSYIGYSVQEG